MVRRVVVVGKGPAPHRRIVAVAEAHREELPGKRRRERDIVQRREQERRDVLRLHAHLRDAERAPAAPAAGLQPRHVLEPRDALREHPARLRAEPRVGERRTQRRRFGIARDKEPGKVADRDGGRVRAQGRGDISGRHPAGRFNRQIETDMAAFGHRAEHAVGLPEPPCELEARDTRRGDAEHRLAHADDVADAQAVLVEARDDDVLAEAAPIPVRAAGTETVSPRVVVFRGRGEHGLGVDGGLVAVRAVAAEPERARRGRAHDRGEGPLSPHVVPHRFRGADGDHFALRPHAEQDRASPGGNNRRAG